MSSRVKVESPRAHLAAPLLLLGAVLAVAAGFAGWFAPSIGGAPLFAAVVVAGALAAAGTWFALPIERDRRSNRAALEIGGGSALLLVATLLVVFHVDNAWTVYLVGAALLGGAGLIGSGAGHLKVASGA